MKKENSIVSWLWKLPACAAAYFVGTVIGGILISAIGVEMPQVPGGADPTLQGLLLIPAGLIFALGLAVMAIGLAGRWWERWLILTAMLFGINGIGNAIETTIFTTLGGPVGAALSFLLPAAFCALAVALLFPGPSETSFAEKAREFFSARKPSKLAIRIVLGILAFPIIYFFFGALVAPIVVPYYEQLDFLKIPPMPVLLSVLHLRSTLILLVTLPVIIGWDGTRARAILGLGLGNATAVGLGGLAQVTFFPAVMRWVHGAEILVDGLVYGLVLALLFIPRLGATKSAAENAPEESADALTAETT
jgi:hypothetical protein